MGWGPQVDAGALLAELGRPTARYPHRRLWILALLFFGIGDVVTTVVGLRIDGVTESSLFAPLVFEYGLAAILLLKLAVFGLCYALWVETPRPYDVGMPLGLAALGGLVTGWNVTVVLLALH